MVALAADQHRPAILSAEIGGSRLIDRAGNKRLIV
jgi:hypothetical protein